MRPTLALALLAGCASQQIKEARALQPNPLAALGSPEELPISDKLCIFQSPPSTIRVFGFHKRKPLLRSWAQFSLVSRDRLRFHVAIARYESDDADTRGWRAWLEDDHGRRVEPEAREVPHVDRYLGWPASDGRNAFVGNADFVFHRRDLVTRDTRGFTLVMERGALTYRFAWEFDGGRVAYHHGISHLDDEGQTYIIPHPAARPLSAEVEPDRW